LPPLPRQVFEAAPLGNLKRPWLKSTFLIGSVFVSIETMKREDERFCGKIVITRCGIAIRGVQEPPAEPVNSGFVSVSYEIECGVVAIPCSLNKLLIRKRHCCTSSRS